MQRLLERQLKRALVLQDQQGVADLLEDLRRVEADPSLPPSVQSVCRGFGSFLTRVESTYAQHDRDQELRIRSLNLSSEELLQANDRLREVAEAQAPIVLSLRTTANELLRSQGQEEIGSEINDLPRLTSLMADLLADRRKALRELEQQKLALDEHAIVTVTDVEGTIVYANDKFCETSGYARSELIGANHRLVSSGLHPRAFFQDLWATIKAGKAWHGEICNRAKDGHLYWVAATILPSQMEGDRPLGYIAIRTDITERRAMEDALRTSQEQLRMAMDASRMGHWDWNTQLDRTDFSDQWLAMLGYKRGDLADAHDVWSSLVHPEDLARAREAFRQNATGVLPAYQVELRMRHKDGSWRWLLSSGRVTAWDASGSAARLLGIDIDITERKEGERALREARDLAVAASRAKSEFLANMSHEIRTPMNGVIGMLGLLMGTGLDQVQRHYAEMAKLSGQSLLSLINDILDLAKVEAGKVELAEEDFDLLRLLDEVGLPMGSRAQQKGLEYLQVLAPDSPRHLRGDARRLRQVLVNLVGNALNFTHRGKVVVRVEPVVLGGPDVLLRFSVQDTGIGIPADKLGDLFQSFSQVDGSTTRRVGGTGLGLAISRQLVTLLGGEIGCSSEEGVGSEFWFTVRLRLSDEDPVPRHPSFTEPTPTARDFHQRRILLVEDNLVNQELALAILGGWDLCVEVACDGMEAIQALRRSDYDLVLMDIQMPKLDGLEATATLRNPASGVRNPAVVVVALTAHAMAEDRQRCLDAGMNDYLTKPLEPGALLAILDRYLPAVGATGRTEPAPVLPDQVPLSSAQPTLSVDFDQAGLLQRLMGNREAAGMVLGSFVEHCPKQLALLAAAVLAGDFEAAAMSAHQLKGSCATVGAAVMLAQVRALEQALQAGDPIPIQAGTASLPGAFDSFRAAVGDLVP